MVVVTVRPSVTTANRRTFLARVTTMSAQDTTGSVDGSE
jgi:hypothetical protein